jgi:hypothetical protein
MRSLVVTAVVTAEHTLTVVVPPDISPGPHQVVLVIDESRPQPPPGLPDFRNWPAHEGTFVDPSCTFRREDLYGDDGR